VPVTGDRGDEVIGTGVVASANDGEAARFVVETVGVAGASWEVLGRQAGTDADGVSAAGALVDYLFASTALVFDPATEVVGGELSGSDVRRLARTVVAEVGSI
jgi:hypothetical protein